MSRREGSHSEVADRYGLTERQRDVLAMMAEGRTNYDIAQALGLSLEGAKYHVSEILGKLGVDSREEAVAIATHRGWRWPSLAAAARDRPRRSACGGGRGCGGAVARSRRRPPSPPGRRTSGRRSSTVRPAARDQARSK